MGKKTPKQTVIHTEGEHTAHEEVFKKNICITTFCMSSLSQLEFDCASSIGTWIQSFNEDNQISGKSLFGSAFVRFLFSTKKNWDELSVMKSEQKILYGNFLLSSGLFFPPCIYPLNSKEFSWGKCTEVLGGLQLGVILSLVIILMFDSLIWSIVCSSFLYIETKLFMP